MQIGTGYFFDSRNRQMGALNGNAARLQEQIATGKRMSAPSEDPVTAGRLARLSITQADQTQFASNVKLAQSLLAQSDNALESIANNLQRAQELAVRANTDTLNDSNRAAIGKELEAILEDLLSLANSTDLRGEALFGGSATGQPYVRANDGSIAFAGTGEAPPVPIGAGVSIQATESGPRLFEGVTVGGAASDMFKIVGDLAKALAPGGSADKAALKQALATGTEGLTKASEKIYAGRASIGARAARLDIEAERLAQAKTDNDLERAGLEGTDIQSTVIELQKTMLALQATQASFSKLSQLSLFDYLR
ncbi:flagellar hook-associated protein FlgL [Sphingomonas sp.]|jgi:flagellar hook-associated protein 3 FlgL|uniref:flagellar hook-associated protein FlgL n=1 Tax=Sphingomonas sp. TaxID=28214 RepID=UPI002DEB9480|nr:flagellar hook-associated protein FlgL [Sphingomonas sp.]HEV2569725.1 flagellar hook-associated protein FlgL [Sphingomonas sp.]